MRPGVLDQRKPVEQLHPSTGAVLRTYEGGSEAAKFMGISQGGISQCCHGKQADSSGFKWRFYEGSLPIDWDALAPRQTPLDTLKAMMVVRAKRKSIVPGPSKPAAAATATTATTAAASAPATASATASASATAAAGGNDDDEDDNDDVDNDDNDDDDLLVASLSSGPRAGKGLSSEKRAPSAYLHYCMEVPPPPTHI